MIMPRPMMPGKTILIFMELHIVLAPRAVTLMKVILYQGGTHMIAPTPMQPLTTSKPQAPWA